MDLGNRGGEGSKDVAVAGTPEQLSATSQLCLGVALTARAGNTGAIAYGFSNAVRATAGSEIGAQLAAGASVFLPITDLVHVWLDAEVSGDGVSYSYVYQRKGT